MYGLILVSCFLFNERNEYHHILTVKYNRKEAKVNKKSLTLCWHAGQEVFSMPEYRLESYTVLHK